MKEAFNIRVEMLRIIDIKFLYGFARPTLCILYEDVSRNTRHIRAQTVDLREKELTSSSFGQCHVENGARLLIPVPSPSNGVIVIGETMITYMNGSNVVQSVVIQPSQICSYGQIDKDGSRYLLGDHRGQLSVLILLKNDDNIVNGVVVEIVGTTSIAEAIVYLDNGIVFIGSLYGDSQVS